MSDGDAVMDQVRQDFGVEVTSLSQVDGGADVTAVVWRAVSADGTAYAVKRGHGGMAAGLPATAYLAARGVRGVPVPLPTRSGRLWSERDGAQLSVVPWVSGRRGIEHGLDTAGWRGLGTLLARVHAVEIPDRSAAPLPAEEYLPVAAPTTRDLDARIRDAAVDGADELTRELVGLWRPATDRIATLVEWAETLARSLRDRPAPHVVTHGDAHLGNVVVADDGQVWLLDWDGTTLAPRERDLMFVVGGILADAPMTPEQRSWFFDGYGRVDIDPARLAYYLCSRALEDIAGWAARVLDERQYPPCERADALAIFRGLLSPTGIVEIALSCLRVLRPITAWEQR